MLREPNFRLIFDSLYKGHLWSTDVAEINRKLGLSASPAGGMHRQLEQMWERAKFEGKQVDILRELIKILTTRLQETLEKAKGRSPRSAGQLKRYAREVQDVLDSFKEELTRVTFEGFPEEPKVAHQEIQEMLVELGSEASFLPKGNYRYSGHIFDVVWKRSPKGSPSHVFEIQVGGNVTDALARLKHAFDLWNSNLFLIASPVDLQKAISLVDGSFHEIKGKIQLWTLGQVKELYESKKKISELEKKLFQK